MQGEGLGLKPPLSLIFYKNLITCTKEINCFHKFLLFFAIMNCCVVALSLFSSDIVTWSADSLYSVQSHKTSGVRIEEYTFCVSKFRENVGLET